MATACERGYRVRTVEMLKSPDDPADAREVPVDSEVPVAAALGGFARCCDAVVDHLRAAVPLGCWSVTRYAGGRQVLLEVRDDVYDLHVGDSIDWADTLCQYSVDGRAPHLAPDVADVALYAGTGAVRDLPIAAYAGVPITRADGSLFGTLCGLDPSAQSATFARHEPLLVLLSSLLAAVLDGELHRVESARLLERAELLAETDVLTGLHNRRGWLQFMDREEQRHRRYGDPAGVIVIDLDGLKEVNDGQGHRAGDELIQLAAVTLQATVRSTELAARLGGDEFGVVATRSTPEQLVVLAERIRASLLAAGVAASIGCAPFGYETGFHGAWDRADAAMYDDKRRRRLV